MTTTKTTWNLDGLCRSHGLTPNAHGTCNACDIGAPVSNPEPLTGIELEWARATTRRMAPGGDLYRAEVL